MLHLAHKAKTNMGKKTTTPEVEPKGLTAMENLMVGIYKGGTDELLRGMIGADLIVEVERSHAAQEVMAEAIGALKVDGYITVDGLTAILEDFHEREVLRGRNE